MTLGDLMKDVRLMEFVTAWQRELHGSKRQKKYIQLLFRSAKITNLDAVNPELVEAFFQSAMSLGIGENSQINNPVARFEILTIADGLGALMLKKMPTKVRKKLEWLEIGVGGISMMAAIEAIRRHMGDVEYDVFISHAAEDKEAVARPLADHLRDRGLRVWYDEYILKVGDSLRREIDKGLAACHFGVVVLSHNFLRKQWPARELDGLAAREIARGEKLVLPIWHDVDAQTIASYSPPLADKVGLNSLIGIDRLAEAIIEAVHTRNQ